MISSRALAVAFFAVWVVSCSSEGLVVDRFEPPVSPPKGSGYYNAQGFAKNCHLGDDWNGVGGGNTDCGDPIFAVAHGEVVYAKDAGGGWGRAVIVRHTLPDGDQVESLYAHLNEIHTKAGARVRRGEKLGTLGDGGGKCGDSTPYLAHLHFEIRTVTDKGLGDGYACEVPEGWVDPTAFMKAFNTGRRP